MQHVYTWLVRHGRAIIVLTAALLLLAYTIDPVRRTILYAVEDTLFSFSKDPERAYAYGVRHFDATHPDLYDLDRAEYFFTEALTLNTAYPLVNHQLARIAFLEGNFALALHRINREIDTNTNVSPSSYYVRGLIKGFAGDYDSAARDYEMYLKSDPNNWAAINDYAWVLLKAKKYDEAFTAVEKGLEVWPNNPWLLNSAAIALFELGDVRAKEFVERAFVSVEGVREEDWLIAYPGNDPLIATEGVRALRDSVMHNRDRVLGSEAL